MKGSQIIAVNVIGLLILALLIIGGYWYISDVSNYVSSSDAKIEGTLTTVTAPTTGVLTAWKPSVGDVVQADQAIGQEDALGRTVSLQTPDTGTVIQSYAVNGQVIGQGQPLATVVDLNKLDVVAMIQETSINDVEVGRTVDVTVDAFPDTSFTGTVQTIGNATANTFSMFPTGNSAGNFTKVVQRIPVTIALSGSEGKRLVPGMNVEVKIHRN